MKIKFVSVLALGAVLSVAACAWQGPVGQAYWQRVEEDSALYMMGPKAQQELDQNIAGCVREIDELVDLKALRETMPPDTHSEYHRALDASGDLAFYDTPTRYGDRMVSHTDFHDFESCMRDKGWERVRFVRYQTSLKASNTYEDTQNLRTWGVSGPAAVQKQEEKVARIQGNYSSLNQ